MQEHLIVFFIKSRHYLPLFSGQWSPLKMAVQKNIDAYQDNINNNAWVVLSRKKSHLRIVVIID